MAVKVSTEVTDRASTETAGSDHRVIQAEQIKRKKGNFMDTGQQHGTDHQRVDDAEEIGSHFRTAVQLDPLPNCQPR